MAEAGERRDPFDLQDLFWLHEDGDLPFDAALYATNDAGPTDWMCLDPEVQTSELSDGQSVASATSAAATFNGDTMINKATCDEEDRWYDALQIQICAFKDDENKLSLITDALVPRQRRKVHAMCHIMRLSRVSYGEQRRKRILVSKCCLGTFRSGKVLERAWNPKGRHWCEGVIDPTILVLDNIEGHDISSPQIRDYLERAGLASPVSVETRLSFSEDSTIPWRPQSFVVFDSVETAGACLIALRAKRDLADNLGANDFEFYKFLPNAQHIQIDQAGDSSPWQLNLLFAHQIPWPRTARLNSQTKRENIPWSVANEPSLPNELTHPFVGAYRFAEEAPVTGGSPPVLVNSSYDMGSETDDTGTGLSSMNSTYSSFSLQDNTSFASMSDLDYSFDHSVTKKRKRHYQQVIPNTALDHDVQGRQCTFDGCGKVFTRECDARKHEKIHYAPRTFQCDRCDKSFLWNKDLKRHGKVHERAEQQAFVNLPTEREDLSAEPLDPELHAQILEYFRGIRKYRE